MIKVSTSPKRRNYIWIPLLASFLLHVGFYAYSSELAIKHKKTYKPIHVVINRVEKPKPEPETAKEKPKPKSKPKPKPKPKEPPKPKPKPKPNVEKPPKPVEPPKEPPKEIFGVTKDSLGTGESGVAVRVGNTLAKDMEKQYTDIDKVKPLAPQPKRPVPVYELTRVPSFKKQVKPEYPPEARRAEIEGVVQLEVLINEKGRVVKVRVLKKLGYGLDEAAVKAVKQSTFIPGLKGKQAVPVKLRIPYRFVLED